MISTVVGALHVMAYLMLIITMPIFTDEKTKTQQVSGR